MAADGVTTVRSNAGPQETNRLEAAVKGKGMTVLAHVDHAAVAGRGRRHTKEFASEQVMSARVGATRAPFVTLKDVAALG